MSIQAKVANLLEKRITKTALVLDVRTWEADTFYEVDLHIPGVDFDPAKGGQHIKCRVAPLSYRDYTISGWDAETKTCTLFIDAAHNGAGSKWVKNLKRDDTLTYLVIEAHRHTIQPHSRLLFLGDQSAIGHFLALQQLAGKDTCIDGAVVIPNPSHRQEFSLYYPGLKLHPLALEQDSTQVLANWINKKEAPGDMIYLAGNAHTVISLRKQLRVMGYAGKQIHAQGFWS